MDGKGNGIFNKYEQHLSPFGRKVMISLLKLKDERKSKTCKTFCPPPQPRYQNGRVLQFDSRSPPKAQIYNKYNLEESTHSESNFTNVENVNFHITDDSQYVSTSSDLLKTPNERILKDDTRETLNDSASHSEMIDNGSCVTNDVINQCNDDVDLGFSKILDINDIFRCVDDTNAHDSVTNKLDTVETKHTVGNETKSNNVSTEEKSTIRKGLKRKNIRVPEGKNNKINANGNEKISYRKRKYTTTVRNWLNSNGGDDLRNELILNGGESRKAKKKTVQTTLANRDGKMKYCKPKQNAGEELPDAIAVNTVTREKKRKPKFVAPIKSQIPVRDIKYTINVINDDGHEVFDGFCHGDVAITLIFSNGFCQLNSKHTDSTCIPEGIMIHLDGTFFYLKGSSNMSAVRRSLSTSTLICYDAKKCVIHLNNFEEPSESWNIFDAKIGGDLVFSDEQPETFSGLQKLLSLTPDHVISSECVLQRTAWYMTLLEDCAVKLRALMIENGVYDLFVNIEMKVLPVLAEMERGGVRVDVARLNAMGDVLSARMKEVEIECYEAAGRKFQINSPPQVRAILYDELKLDTKCDVIHETVRKGAKSTSEAVLRSLSGLHPLPRRVLEYRHLHKAHATFVAGIAHHAVDGVVRPTWDQTAAVTGRIASNSPNLQAIPKTFDLVLFPKDGVEPVRVNFRSAYTCRAAHWLVAADFRQVECRVVAHLAGEQQLLHALRSPDLFTVLAAHWLQKAESEVSKEERERTKRLVYASVYGAGARRLARILRAERRQALGILASFNRRFPSLKTFVRSVADECARAGGRVRTRGGRTRTFPNILSPDRGLRAQAERQAVNFIVQGTAAELSKRATWRACEALRAGGRGGRGGRGARLRLSVHDELLWELPAAELHAAAAIIKAAMENCGRECGMDINLPVAMYYGASWGEMVEFTPRENGDLCSPEDFN